ncbi:hypothetical protein V8C26DRAFT_424560 [Trichoderma gracile]
MCVRACALCHSTTASSSWFSRMLIGGILNGALPLGFRASTAYLPGLFVALVRWFLRARTTRQIARGFSLQWCKSASQLNRCKHGETTQGGAGNK